MKNLIFRYLIMLGSLFCCFFQNKPDAAHTPNTLTFYHDLDSVYQTLSQQTKTLAADSVSAKQLAGHLSDLGRKADSLSLSQLAVNAYADAFQLLIKYQAPRRQVIQATLDYGIALRNNNDLDTAIIVLQEALKLSDQYYTDKKERWKVGTCYNHIGATYTAKGDFYQAIQYFRKQYELLLIVNTDPKDRKYLSYPLCDMGHAYANLKDYTTAAKLYEQGLEIGGDMHGQQHVFWGTVSDYYRDAHDLDNALRTQLQAVTMKQAIYQNQPSVDLGAAYRKLGVIYIDRQDAKRGDSLLLLSQQVLEQCQGTLKTEWISTILELAELRLAQHRYREGHQYCQMALSACLDGVNEGDRTSSNKAVIQSKYPQLLVATMQLTGDLWSVEDADPAALKQAIDAYSYAIQCNEILYRNMEDERSKSFLIESAAPLFEKAIQTAYRWNNSGKNEDALDFAHEFMEKSKANLLLEALRESGARSFAGIPQPIIDQERQLKNRKLKLESDLEIYLEYYSENDPQVKSIRDALFETDRAFQDLKSKMEHDYPTYFQFRYATQTADRKRVQQLLGQHQSALLTMFWGAEHLFVLYSDKEQSRIHIANIDSALTNNIGRIRAFLTQNRPDAESSALLWAKESASLYQQVLAPALGADSPERLIVIPDGPFAALPLQTLCTDQPTGSSFREFPFLIKKHLISYAYSATSLLEPHQTMAGLKSVGAFAPSYSTAGSTTDIPSTLLSRRNIFQPLPHSRDEVAVITSMAQGEAFMDTAANESRFKQVAGQFRILHLAMHGQANDSLPGQSFLAFSNDQHGGEDDLLHSYEIYGLPIGADLAWLSACETGKGQWQRGEGILSIGRAFRFAGCPSIIAGYWDVNDAAALNITKKFYQYLFNQNDYTLSLELAKRDLLLNETDERLNHPSLWGSLNLTGGMLEASSGYSLFVLGGLITLLILAAGWWLFRKSK